MRAGVIVLAAAMLIIAARDGASQDRSSEKSIVALVDSPRGRTWCRIHGWDAPKTGVTVTFDEVTVGKAIGLEPKVSGADKSLYPREVEWMAGAPTVGVYFDLRSKSAGPAPLPEGKGREVTGTLPVLTKEPALTPAIAVVPAPPKAFPLPVAPKKEDIKVRKTWMYIATGESCFYCLKLKASLKDWKDFNDGVANESIELKQGTVEGAPFKADYLTKFETIPVIWAGYWDEGGKKVATILVNGWDADAPVELDGRPTTLLLAVQWRLYMLRTSKTPEKATLVFNPPK